MIVRERQEPRALRPDESSRGRGRQGRARSGSSCTTAARSTPERIWSDAKADIAVLKLDRDDLPAARHGQQRRRPRSGPGSWPWAVRSA